MSDPTMEQDIARFRERAVRGDTRPLGEDIAVELWDQVAALTRERNEVKADLAAARAALEKIGNSVVIDDEFARDVAKRLGTGEALAAVREAQDVLSGLKALKHGYPTPAIDSALARLKAVFGE